MARREQEADALEVSTDVVQAILMNGPQPSTSERQRLDSILLPYQEATRYVASNYGKLLRKYPEQWIAVTGHDVITASPRRDVIGQRLRRAPVERNKIYVTFLTKKKQTLIL